MYFHDLGQFEDWSSHVSQLLSCFGADNPKINQALAIVKRYHDQPRTTGFGNYNRHPVRVARILIEEMKVTSEQTILIALCHDLGEWSEYDVSQLTNEFGEEVLTGVQTLTWDQKGEWSQFVERIVASNINDLIAIKIADKLDNNRAVALSGSENDKVRARAKTNQVIMPLVREYYPSMMSAYEEVMSRFE